MIREAVRGEDEDDADCNLALPHVLLLAVATSIDAFAVGITFAFLKVDILSSIAIIGVTTFVLCFAAVYLGSKLIMACGTGKTLTSLRWLSFKISTSIVFP